MGRDMRSTISRVGKYELKSVLARTALSTVYDGWDSDIARRVAIKLMPLSNAGDDEAREALARFKRGARAAGQLNHPNIVSVYDYGETEDYAYLVMEFIDGPTLKGLFDENRRFALREIAVIVGSILDALQYSHDRKVVHRDMKPANVMFTGDNTVKITDFGIARLEDSEMTQAGMVIGTPAYMSPEQFLGEKIDWRTDIYSTGVLLYQILTGERPYEGTLATIMHKVLYGAPLLPSRLSTLATPALDQVITRAMARRREERFESASEFKAELQRALIGTTAKADRLVPPLAEQRKPARSAIALPTSGPVIYAAAAAAAIIAIGAIAWFAHSGPEPVQLAREQPQHRPEAPLVAAAPPAAPSETKAPPAPETPPAVQPEQDIASADQRDASASYRPDTFRPSSGPASESRQPEDPHRVPEAPVAPVPVFAPPARNAIERKPPPATVVTKPPAGEKVAGPEHRLALADGKNGRSPQEQGNRPAPPNDATGDEINEALRRLRNGTASRTDPAAETLPGPALYAATSSSPVGLLCQSVTADTAGSFGLDSPRGMVVIGVTTGSAAAKAGIRQEDVILKINGSDVRDLSVLHKLAAETTAGRTVPVELFRHGAHQVVQLHVDQLR